MVETLKMIIYEYVGNYLNYVKKVLFKTWE